MSQRDSVSSRATSWPIFQRNQLRDLPRCKVKTVLAELFEANTELTAAVCQATSSFEVSVLAHLRPECSHGQLPNVRDGWRLSSYLQESVQREGAAARARVYES